MLAHCRACSGPARPSGRHPTVAQPALPGVGAALRGAHGGRGRQGHGVGGQGRAALVGCVGRVLTLSLIHI
eukprot:12745178-Alexandrium_andersonii.AAC.1